jgi:S-disulfanyl-L-cysteine oxidoreductase SoxD
MFTRETLALAFAIALGASGLARAQTPALGAPVTDRDAAAWNIDIAPDGAGLPKGAGTARQGKAVYAAKCASCHGATGDGTPSDRLVGGFGDKGGGPPAAKTVGSYWPYATTLFDYIRRAMPLNKPKSLSDDEVFALSAYLLERNGIIRADQTMNAKTLPKVVMPNRASFFAIYPGKME